MSEYKHFVGRVGTKPERAAKHNLVKFRLAVDNGWDKALGQMNTMWYDVATWEGLADIAESQLSVGSRIAVSGNYSVFTSSSGKEYPQINAREIYFVDSIALAEESGTGVEEIVDAYADPEDDEDDDDEEW